MDQSTSDERELSDLPDLVEECLRLMEDGGSVAVDDFLAGHRPQAGEVRRRLKALSKVGFLEDTNGDSSDFPERLGDFRLLERIGGGGMGVVYLAEQDRLGRRVALKLVRPDQLYFERSRERFRREVDAVSRLEHPGIVAIYAYGEEQGVPYYAMEFVAGKSLSAVLDELRGTPPEKLSGANLRAVLREGSDKDSTTSHSDLFGKSWIEVCFRIVEQVASALDHAHRRGVLHRDVKPSNIMLTPDGRARLLDFGLARAAHSPDLTASGSMLGSLPYMAPEQIFGDRENIGPATDVYGLAVTLYEMLTLRSPYWAETAERTRQRVLDGRPPALAQLNSAVPWDAETVCLKAMAPELGQRYATMLDFHEEAGRIVRREPIRAKRPGVALRARRWAQRRPALATALAFGLFLVVGGPTVYALYANYKNAELRAETRRAEENAALADKRLEDNTAAIDALLSQAVNMEFANQPGVDPARRKMLEQAAVMFEGLAEQEAGNGRIAMRVVHAHFRLGEIRTQLGSLEEGVASLRTALALTEDLTGVGEQPVTYLRNRVQTALVRALQWSNKIQEAGELAQRLVAELDETVERFPALGDLSTRQRAEALTVQARSAARAGDAEKALRLMKDAVSCLEERFGENPESDAALSALANAGNRYAYYLAYFKRDEGARALFAAAAERQRQSVQRQPNADRRAQLGQMLITWGQTETWRREWPEAIARTAEAVVIFEDLASDYPDRVPYATNLLRASHQLGWLQFEAGDRDAGMETLARGAERSARVLQRLPNVPDTVQYAAILHSELAYKLSLGARFEEADPHWAQAEGLWQRLGQIEGGPRRSYLDGIGTMTDNWARAERKRGRLERALELARQACAHHREAIGEFPKRTLTRARLGKSLVLEMAVLTDLQRAAQAVALFAETRGEADYNWATVFGEMTPRLGDRADFREALRGKIGVFRRPRVAPIRLRP